MYKGIQGEQEFTVLLQGVQENTGCTLEYTWYTRVYRVFVYKVFTGCARYTGCTVGYTGVQGIQGVLEYTWYPGGGGVLQISSVGDDQMGAKIKTQKNS